MPFLASGVMNFLKYKNVNSLTILSVTGHKKQEINGSWLKVEQNIYYTKLIWMFLEYEYYPFQFYSQY